MTTSKCPQVEILELKALIRDLEYEIDLTRDGGYDDGYQDGKVHGYDVGFEEGLYAGRE